MAKKKGSKKHKPGKHRRIGGMQLGDGGKMVGGAIVGALVAAFVDTKMMSATSAKTRGLVAIGAGVLGAWKIKSPLWKGAAMGVASYGGLRLAQGMTVLTLTGANCNSGDAGMGRTPRMNGFYDVPGIGRVTPSKFPTPSAVGSTRRRNMAAMAAGAGM